MNDVLYYFLLVLLILLPLLAILVLFYVASILWTFGNALPYVPTPKLAIRKMIEAAELRPSDHVVDLGSGTGTMTQMVAAKTMNPITGIEKLWVLLMLSRLRRLFRFRNRQDYCLRQGDMRQFPFATADVILGFWLPSMLEQLAPKFEKEMKHGGRVLSYLFPVPLGPHWSATKIPVKIWGKVGWIYKYKKNS